MTDELLNDLDYMAMNAVIKGSTPEKAAARIRELESEVARLREANRDAFLRERDAAGDAWNAALEEAAEVAMGQLVDSSAWEHAQHVAAAIRALKRETKE